MVWRKRLAASSSIDHDIHTYTYAHECRAKLINNKETVQGLRHITHVELEHRQIDHSDCLIELLCMGPLQ